ncbi:MAG: tetratricopeptide repeat protein [Aquificaceae bacterium]|nr:tetratricopeptide repeat protein [Aquificaceae bacterium]MDW8294625.1 tetratricopeptide repeat protein [Aquificaceae bacterium]
MRYLSLLLLASIALAYNPYADYVLCRLHQEREPLKAKEYCLRALEKAPTPSLYVDVVRLEMQLKNSEKALKIALDFKTKYPDLSEPYILLHSIHTARREQDSALKVLEEGYIKNPQSKEVMVFLAEEYLRRGEPLKAKGVLQNLAKVSPDNPLPYFMLARIALSEGKQEEAIDFLQKSLKVNPTFPAGFITLGGIYEQRGEYSRAEDLYKDILKQDPGNRNALERLGNLYTIRGRYEEAKEVYKRLVELYAESTHLYQYSLVLIRAGQQEEARSILERLYEENPENPDVAYTYAMLLEVLKERDRALAIYTSLQKRLGNNPRIIERLAGIYIDKKDYAKAEELLRLGLSVEPNSLQLNLMMGHLLKERERYEEALGYIEKAIQIDHKDYRGYFLRAIVYDNMGKIVSAESDLRKALELRPEDPELLNHLGYSLLLWYQAVRLEEAELLIKKALEKEPENPAYIDSMAWVLYHRGDYRGAYELLLKALEKEKEDPVLYEHMGDVLSKLGREKEAQENYRRAYELLTSGKKGEPNQRERLKGKLKGL